MIHSLRRAHWRWLVVLAIALPILLLAFLGARDFSKHRADLPDEVTHPPQEQVKKTP